jgi:hypothetical protein
VNQRGSPEHSDSLSGIIDRAVPRFHVSSPRLTTALCGFIPSVDLHFVPPHHSGINEAPLQQVSAFARTDA